MRRISKEIDRRNSLESKFFKFGVRMFYLFIGVFIGGLAGSKKEIWVILTILSLCLVLAGGSILAGFIYSYKTGDIIKKNLEKKE